MSTPRPIVHHGDCDVADGTRRVNRTIERIHP